MMLHRALVVFLTDFSICSRLFCHCSKIYSIQHVVILSLFLYCWNMQLVIWH